MKSYFNKLLLVTGIVLALVTVGFTSDVEDPPVKDVALFDQVLEVDVDLVAPVEYWVTNCFIQAYDLEKESFIQIVNQKGDKPDSEYEYAYRKARDGLICRPSAVSFQTIETDISTNQSNNGFVVASGYRLNKLKVLRKFLA